MSAIYDYQGVVENVLPVQTVGANGFRKRDLILTDDEGTMSRYPNHLPFTFKQDKVALLDKITKGQRVKVRFAIDGRIWHSPKTDQDMYFKDLVGLQVEVVGEGGAQGAPEEMEPAVPDMAAASAGDPDDLPF